LPGSDPATDRETLAAALREAGAVALKTFQTPLRTWLKGQGSPVSEADIAVDDFLRGRLAGPASGCGWLSEETEERPSAGAARLWIVDPIDGTRAYLARQPDWSISAALVADGRPILSGVFAPVTDELFVAALGLGATRNGAPIAASAGGSLAGAKVGGPKPLLAALAAVEPRIEAIPRIGSLALRLARVAQGALDIAFVGGTCHDWDLAGADLLVHEAGGAMTSLVGRGLTYNQPDLAHGTLVAAGAARHAALIARMRERDAEFG